MTWPYSTPEARAKRDGRIMELWQMGLDRREIATLVDLTPQRVSQIVRSFGATFRGGDVETDLNRP